MNIKKLVIISFLLLFSAATKAQVGSKFEELMFGSKKQIKHKSQGHSHNDYKQNIPFFRAYYAGMESIEADVFLLDNKLFVAHEKSEIKPGHTLDSLYLRPLATLFHENNQHPFADTNKSLQLVIDIKENYQQVIPAILKALERYPQIFNKTLNPHAIQVVLSGDLPPATSFEQYPLLLSFDGRPGRVYTADQLKRVAMISQDIKLFSTWNGKGTPTPQDKQKLQKAIDEAHQLGKPFRFWATHDSPNTWLELEKLGVDWINIDHPENLKKYYDELSSTIFTNSKAIPVYQPKYDVDGSENVIHNVILLIGDGMGLAQIKAGLSANYGTLSITNIRNIGLSRTEASNSDNTDSAAGATALSSGKKTNNRYVGTDSSGAILQTIPLLIRPHGIESALLSTGDATDATPASFYAAQPERDWSEKIAYDFLQRPSSILLGGVPPWYKDGSKKDKYERLLKTAGYKISYSLADFKQESALKQVVFLPDTAIRPVKDGRGLLLKESLERSISLFQMHKKPFFIMAEGAQIDYGGHANDLPYVVTEMLDFDQAIAAALKFADQDKHTLVIVTADHETGGLSLLDADRKRGYIRGNFSTNDHTNISVPVFAYGPHAEIFRGVYENTAIFDKIISLLIPKKFSKK